MNVTDARTALPVEVWGVGLLGPGLDGWDGSRAVLAEPSRYAFAPMRSPAPSALAAAERRRASVAIRLALEVAQQAVAQATVDPAALAAIFTSCDGDADTIHAVCTAISEPGYPVSPTRFTNSVHNAPAGYWSIAMRAARSSTSLCAWEGSFAAGLLEAVSQLLVDPAPVLLVASDVPMPGPLAPLHQNAYPFGGALVLGRAGTRGGAGGSAASGSLATLAVRPVPGDPASADGWPQGVTRELEENPSAQMLRLLSPVAAGVARRVRLPYLPHLSVEVDVGCGSDAGCGAAR